LQTELLSLSCSRDKLCVVEIVVVHFVQFVFCQRLTKKQAANAFEPLWVSRCYSFPLFRNNKTTLNPINSLWIFKFAFPDELKLLVIFSFWWTCFWWHHHFRSAMSSGALLTSGAVLLQTLLSFLFVQFSALFCSSRIYKWTQNFCLWSCTLEQILAYPINNFLILYYHSKLLKIMLNTFCSNSVYADGGAITMDQFCVCRNHSYNL